MPGLVREDSVANGQRAEKGGDVPRLFGCPVCDVFGELGCDERELVELCVPVLEELGEGGHHGVFEHGQLARELLGLDSVRAAFSRRGATLGLRDAFPIHHPVDGALLELHDVLRERPGLVGKDVFDLTEVVRDTPVLGDAGGVKGFVVHVDVLCDEVGLDRLDDFDRDEERYGDDVLECDEAGAATSPQTGAGTTRGGDSHKGNERVEDGRARRIYARFIYLDARVRLTIQDTIDHCGERTDDEQEGKVDDDVKVGFLGDLGLFRWGYTAVQVDLGVRAREGDQADNPGCVAHGAATKEEFVDRDTFLPRVPAGGVCVAQHPAVEVQILVRRLRIEDERRFLDVFFRDNGRGGVDSPAGFQVGLPVQVLGLQVADPIRVRGRQYDHVRGDLFVLPQQHNVADFQLLPERPFPPGGAVGSPIPVNDAKRGARRDALLVCRMRGLLAPSADFCGRRQPGRVRVGIDAGNVFEVSPTRPGRSAEAEHALVGVPRAYADPVSFDALAEHDPHAFAGFLFAELLDAF
jgi:hypothetical protein